MLVADAVHSAQRVNIQQAEEFIYLNVDSNSVMQYTRRALVFITKPNHVPACIGYSFIASQYGRAGTPQNRSTRQEVFRPAART